MPGPQSGLALFSTQRACHFAVGPASTRTLGVACPPTAQHQHYQETHRARSAARVFSLHAGGIAGSSCKERQPKVRLARRVLHPRREVAFRGTQQHASGQQLHLHIGRCRLVTSCHISKFPTQHSGGSTVQRLTPRSSRAPTACHTGPAGGTRYIFAIRARAPRRWCRLNSNVRRHKSTRPRGQSVVLHVSL